MSRKTTAAITTACVSVAACTAAYMMSGNNRNSKAMRNRTKQWKKTAGRTLHQVGDFIDNVSYMMK